VGEGAEHVSHFNLKFVGDESLSVNNRCFLIQFCQLRAHHKSYYGDQINEDEMGGAYSTQDVMTDATFWSQHVKVALVM
jgi:hypothetical protein